MHSVCDLETERLQSWGHTFQTNQKVIRPKSTTDLCFPKSLSIAYGCGNSYGDVCLNHGEAVISTARLRRILSFDPAIGVVDCEPGVRIGEILELCRPHGWLFPSCPGIGDISIGGAIANDVHGKNQARSGSIGNHLLDFDLLGTQGGIQRHTPGEDLFAATVGGLGLTGLISRARLSLARMPSQTVRVKSTAIAGASDFISLSFTSSAEFHAGWMDLGASGVRFARGLLFEADFVSEHEAPPRSLPRWQVPRVASWLATPAVIRQMNWMYFKLSKKSRALPVERFLFPFDRILNFNRVYGNKGVHQLHCLVPERNRDALKDLLAEIERFSERPYLAILKRFGSVPSLGMLSFPREGYALAADFPNRGTSTVGHIRRLYDLVLEAGGKIYPAKDSVMTPEQFRKSFPSWRRFGEFIDPSCSSSFWRRVQGSV